MSSTPASPVSPPRSLANRVLGVWRLLAGLTVLGVGAGLWGLFLIPLLPWRLQRIRACNHFGTIVGSRIARISGARVHTSGMENAAGPAIFVSNHTSTLDLFVAMWLSPLGTVGVAKKEIIWTPFLGQLYLLSGHLRIDRGRSEKAKRSLGALAKLVHEKGLSIFIWPEGTRSKNGQRKPFKKGAFHLALSTGLPIVPMVVKGAHQSWPQASLTPIGGDVHITFLPPMSTADWHADTLDAHVRDVEAAFDAALGAQAAV